MKFFLCCPQQLMMLSSQQRVMRKNKSSSYSAGSLYWLTRVFCLLSISIFCLTWRDMMWGQHQNIKNQISQHFADRCLGIRENIGKLFIIILASLIWLIICWHQDRSIIFPIYVQSFIFTKKILFYSIFSRLSIFHRRR